MIQKDRWSGWFHFTESRKCSWMGGGGVTGWGRGSLDGESLLNTGSQALSATRVARAAGLLSRLVVFMCFPQNLVKWLAKCRCLSFWHCWFH